MKGERSGGGGGCLMSGGGGGRCAATNSNSHVNGVNYILHTVSKMDTLAGVAIKYGVEVIFQKPMWEKANILFCFGSDFVIRSILVEFLGLNCVLLGGFVGSAVLNYLIVKLVG